MLVVGVGTAVRAQGGNPLLAIQGTLNALVESVNAIGDAVEPGNVLSTTAVFVDNSEFTRFVVVSLCEQPKTSP
jgi:hypothetical protein